MKRLTKEDVMLMATGILFIGLTAVFLYDRFHPTPQSVQNTTQVSKNVTEPKTWPCALKDCKG